MDRHHPLVTWVQTPNPTGITPTFILSHPAWVLLECPMHLLRVCRTTWHNLLDSLHSLAEHLSHG